MIEILELSSSDNELTFDPFSIEHNIVERKNTLKKNMKKALSNKNVIFDSQKQRNEEEKKNHELFFIIYNNN